MRKTHSDTEFVTEHFEHPETHKVITTRVRRRLPLETLRLQRLVGQLDKSRSS